MKKKIATRISHHHMNVTVKKNVDEGKKCTRTMIGVRKKFKLLMEYFVVTDSPRKNACDYEVLILPSPMIFPFRLLVSGRLDAAKRYSTSIDCQ